MTLTEPTERYPRWRIVAAVIALIVYAGALVYGFEDYPLALTNDAAQEIQTGYLLWERGEFRVLAFDPADNGVETLWVAVAGLFVYLFGHDTAPALAYTWLAAWLTVALLFWLAMRHKREIDPLLIVLIAIALPWLFHYGRGGLRATSTPMWFAGSLVGVSFLLRNPKSWIGPVVLALSIAGGIYSYTAFRAIAIGYVFFAGMHFYAVRRDPEHFALIRRAHFRTIGMLLVLGLPAIDYAIRDHRTYFFRGTYNIRGDYADRALHVIESLLIPVYYRDRGVWVATPQYLFDSLAMVLPVARIMPVPVFIGLAAFGGMLITRWRTPSVAWFAIIGYVMTAVLIGFTGPSLTRIIGELTTIVFFAAVGLTALARHRPAISPLIVLALVVTAGISGARYFARVNAPPCDIYYAFGPETLGRYIVTAVGEGKSLAAFVAQDANTVRFYAYPVRGKFHLVDAYWRPIYPENISQQTLDSLDELIIHSSDRLSELREWARARFKRIDTGLGSSFEVFDPKQPADAGETP